MYAGAHAPLQQLHHVVDVDDDDVDGFSEEELSRRPEVRFINKFAVLRTYMLMGLKGSGVLVLLWATVVLLGGFVSKLEKKDFWYITFIAFVQAGGMFNAIFDNELKPLASWFNSTIKKFVLPSSRVKHNHDDMKVHRTCWCWWWWKTIIKSMICRVTDLIKSVVLYLVLAFFLYSPIICALLSYTRIAELHNGSSNQDDTEEVNLRPGLNLFYYLCIAQGILFAFIVIPAETFGTNFVVNKVSRQVGFSRGVVFGYCNKTKLKYLKNLSSSDESWNFITYGAALLDSEMPQDYASGARVLTTLIQQGVPVRRLLLRSTRRRIQKLIGTLAWRNPAERETRWLAARIVEHVAPDLSLAQLPGAVECISSLLDTSVYNKDGGGQEHEATHFVAQLRLANAKQPAKQKSDSLWKKFDEWIDCLIYGPVQSINLVEETNEDLILLGLRILENLALDELNCRVICSSDALLSKITAPLNSGNLTPEDMETNTAWAKVIDGSLKLVSRLMRTPGDTGKEMRRRVADNSSSAVKILEKFLTQEINSSDIIVLQIRAIDILEQLCSDDESTSSNKLITKAKDIFFTDKWMGDYLSKLEEEIKSQLEKSKKLKKRQQQELVVNQMKAAQESVSHLKEKAGEALASLCVVNQIPANVLHYLTDMLDSKSVAITVRCRISAAVILKHLCTHCSTSSLDHDYLKKRTLEEVLRVLLHIKEGEQATSTSKLVQWWQRTISKAGGHDEGHRVQGYKQQHEERMLQVALLSLCKVIRERWISAAEFASVVAQLTSPKDDAVAQKLKKLVEENSYATPSCRAIVKLTCELIKELIPHNHRAEEVRMMEDIVESLYQASKTMAGLESCMLFAGTDRDCYGIPVKPFCSDLVEEAKELLK